MASSIDEITIQYEENGEVLVKELKKEILTRGAWATILFLYQDLDKKTKAFEPPKASIRRYRKKDGKYMTQSKFTLSNAQQARQVAEILLKWFPVEK